MGSLYKREMYLQKIRPYYDDTEIVKIITGVMGCGKTSLIEMIIEELKEKGIPDENIIKINLDKRPYKGIRTFDKLTEIIAKKSVGVEGIKYVFLDELQNVSEFEMTLNTCYKEGNFSIFATASNGYVLYPKHVKRLLARYVNYEMFTLSFNEYVEMKSFCGRKVSGNLEEEFTKYMLEGGFPYNVQNKQLGNEYKYTEYIFEKIFEEVVRKNKRVKNREMYSAIERYIIDNFGRTISIKGMQEYLAETLNQSIRKETLYNYMQILEDARIVYKCSRFDINEKRLLKGKEKYYLSDLSFYYALDRYNTLEYAPSLENTLYCYARVSDYGIAKGRIGRNDVDFILEDADMDYSYVQVANHIINGEIDESGNTKEEEKAYRPLENIRDSYPKYVMTLDKITRKRNGIKHKNIIDFMKNNEKF